MTPEPCEIRTALAEDAPALVEIERAASSYPWSLSQLLNSLRSREERGLLVSAGEARVGFAIFNQVLDEATLLNIAVHPSAQGQGYGNALLGAVLENLVASGARRCLLEVRAGNDPALGLYHRFGFEEDGRRRGYYPGRDGREDAVLMSRPLGAGV